MNYEIGQMFRKGREIRVIEYIDGSKMPTLTLRCYNGQRDVSHPKMWQWKLWMRQADYLGRLSPEVEPCERCKNQRRCVQGRCLDCHAAYPGWAA